MVDAGLLRPGEDFSLLPNSFVIFLCTFDPFGYGRWRYTFKECCLEDGTNLGDGTCKVFLNTKGIHKEQVTPELVRFLSYAGGERPVEYGERAEDALIRQIDLRIASLKQNRRMEEQYMLFSEMLDDERKEGYADGYKSGAEDGRKKGAAEGENRLLALISRMQQEGLGAEIPRLHAEPEFLKKMYRRFQMEEKV